MMLLKELKKLISVRLTPYSITYIQNLTKEILIIFFNLIKMLNTNFADRFKMAIMCLKFAWMPLVSKFMF